MGHAETIPALLTPEEYLAAEEASDVKHEYVAGVIYAMAGGPEEHSLIAMNASGSLYGQLRGRKCRTYNSDMRVRVQFPTHTRFYYPDAQVVCTPPTRKHTYQDEPAVVIEVLSESTRRTDEQEKREAYLTIGSLAAYILIEQDRPAATVWRRHSAGFTRERYEGIEATIPLPEIQAALPLADVYEGVEFADAEADEFGAMS
jgi:Uma2 family endonuclease